MDNKSETDQQFFSERMKMLMKSVFLKLSASSVRLYEPYQLTPPQAGILSLLIKMGKGKVSDLGTKLHTADSNISAICSRLEKRHLVKRERDENDQRIVYIKPTEEAYLLMRQIKSETNENNKILFEANIMTADDMHLLLSAFERLDQLLDSAETLYLNKKRNEG